MSPRAARQIREGILIARQTMRHDRVGPRRFRSALAAQANADYRYHHTYWSDLRTFSPRHP